MAAPRVRSDSYTSLEDSETENSHDSDAAQLELLVQDPFSPLHGESVVDDDNSRHGEHEHEHE